MAARAPAYTRPHHSVETRQEAVDLVRAGYTEGEAGEMTGMSQSTVSANLHKLEEHHTLVDRPRSGRPRKLVQPLVGHVKVRAELGHYDNSAQAARELAAVDGVNVCARTVRRSLRREGIVIKRKPHNRLITPKQRQARLKFAREHLNVDLTDFISVDETPLHRQEKGRQKFVFAHVGHALPASAHAEELPYQGGKKLNLWAAISRAGVLAWHVYDANLTASLYKDLLENKLLPAAEARYGAREWKIQQDNARPHTAKIVKTWLKRAQRDHHFSVMEWPVNSPDLSPSENFWWELKSYLSTQGTAPTTTALRARVDAAVHYFNTERVHMFEHYFDSMPARLQAVIHAHGGHTSY